jgi:hypothetical protein
MILGVLHERKSMRNENLKHLELLGMFHYIIGGIAALFASTPLMHVFMGLAMLSGKFSEGSNGSGPPLIVGWMFVIMGAIFVVLGWSMAVCIILAGKKLKQHKNQMFCMVVAGIECVFIPFGTILGVLTLITLSKDSVKEIFAEQAAARNALTRVRAP